MKTDYWLVCFTILASVFLVSCQSEPVEKEDRLIIDFAAIDDVFPQAQGINIYKTCSKGKDFSNKNLEILLRGWNEVMEELKNPSVRSSLFKKTDLRFSFGTRHGLIMIQEMNSKQCGKSFMMKDGALASISTDMQRRN